MAGAYKRPHRALRRRPPTTSPQRLELRVSPRRDHRPRVLSQFRGLHNLVNREIPRRASPTNPDSPDIILLLDNLATRLQDNLEHTLNRILGSRAFTQHNRTRLPDNRQQPSPVRLPLVRQPIGLSRPVRTACKGRLEPTSLLPGQRPLQR